MSQRQAIGLVVFFGLATVAVLYGLGALTATRPETMYYMHLTSPLTSQHFRYGPMTEGACQEMMTSTMEFISLDYPTVQEFLEKGRVVVQCSTEPTVPKIAAPPEETL